LDVLTLFSIVVFSISWLFYARTPAEEPLVKLFFAFMLGMSALIGFMGIALRYLNQLNP
jgi:hypothetical protein